MTRQGVSLDPWGHRVAEVFADELAAGFDIRPTIAITKARIALPEMREAIAAGRIKPDNRILMPSGEASVVKAAIEPVWHLPVIARRLGTKETDLRRLLFKHAGAIFNELVTRPDKHVFQRSIADITFIWPRLTWPPLANRHAVPWSRKMSAISRAGRAMRTARYAAGAGLPLLFARLCISNSRSSGLSTAEIMPRRHPLHHALLACLWPSAMSIASSKRMIPLNQEEKTAGKSAFQ